MTDDVGICSQVNIQAFEWHNIFLITKPKNLRGAFQDQDGGLACRLELGKPRLVNSFTAVTIPFYDRVIFVRLLYSTDLAG